MIPEAAVEAGMGAMLDPANPDLKGALRAALEAAAPHMQARLLRHLLEGMRPWAGDKEVGFMEGALEAAVDASHE